VKRAAPLPVGETGAARARAGCAEGDHPACTSHRRHITAPVGRRGRLGIRRIAPRSGSLARARVEPSALARGRAGFGGKGKHVEVFGVFG